VDSYDPRAKNEGNGRPYQQRFSNRCNKKIIIIPEITFVVISFFVSLHRNQKTITTMTVKELIEILKGFDEDANVFCWDNCGGAYTVSDVEYNETYNQVELS
jgi:hypothetical protein